MVPGSSIAPRSRGSSAWTCDVNAPSRRGGLRGPRRPRVPLLLLATGSSFDVGVRGDRSRCQRLEERGRERGLQRPCQGAFLDGAFRCRPGPGTRMRRGRRAARWDRTRRHAPGCARCAAARAWGERSGKRRRIRAGVRRGGWPIAAGRAAGATTPPPRRRERRRRPRRSSWSPALAWRRFRMRLQRPSPWRPRPWASQPQSWPSSLSWQLPWSW